MDSYEQWVYEERIRQLEDKVRQLREQNRHAVRDLAAVGRRQIKRDEGGRFVAQAVSITRQQAVALASMFLHNLPKDSCATVQGMDNYGGLLVESALGKHRLPATGGSILYSLENSGNCAHVQES